MDNICSMLLENEDYLNEDNFHINMLVWYYKENENELEIQKNDFIIMNKIFEKCKILDKSNTKNIRLENVRNKMIYECENIKKLYSCENIDINVDDICNLNCRNIPTILNYLCGRLSNDIIYTNLSHLLIVINPFKCLNDTNETIIKKYKYMENEKNLKSHIFKKARTALYNLKNLSKKNQYIIVSGESGSGKTEACKNAMKFLTYNEIKERTKVPEIILNTNVLLEFFGNAKTIHNNNSSRFGKSVKLYIDENNNVQSGYIKAFLLEKSRIIKQEKEERNFHIFYEMLNYLNNKENIFLYKENFKNYSTNIEYYNILNKSDLKFSNEQKNKFHEIITSFHYLNLNDKQINDIISILFGILLLGNVKIVEKENSCGIARGVIENYEEFKKACEALFLDDIALENICSTKITTIGKTEIKSSFTKEEMETMLHSFSKIIYYNLFSWIIDRINNLINPLYEKENQNENENEEIHLNKNENLDLNTQLNNNRNFIGILDIFGFEIFSKNSLEQLLINIANERIQQFFLNTVFEKENEIYIKENIDIPLIQYTPNYNLLNVLYKEPVSILNFLEDCCLTPKSTDLTFTMLCNKHFGILDKQNEKSIYKITSNSYDNTKNQLLKKTNSTNSDLKNIKSNIFPEKDHQNYKKYASEIYIKNKSSNAKKFTISHSIGKIEYTTDDFIFKNKDVIKSEFIDISKSSSNEIFQNLFKDCIIEKGKLSKRLLISSQYIKQLDKLINEINTCEIHFIRCIKSNEFGKPNHFDEKRVFLQCYSLSLFHALQLKNFSFSYKFTFEEFYEQFKLIYMLNNLYEPIIYSEINAKIKTISICENCQLSIESYKIGLTKIFLNIESLTTIKKQMNNLINKWSSVVSILYAFVKKYKKKKNFKEKCLTYLPRIQAHIRKYLVLHKIISHINRNETLKENIF
ncbi:hypothetical protein PGAL8A_00141600 [Plasmodium gallinaceum]|uniref:Myosin motor domain-containing protein n=1 Tax=Plasmodium gallinaceum TaxID=5849 RepID=A0A1J1GMQ7_PLAGA|nr:hypothetical protein PGAL8A_00141600 [Plasmodium gallinaceum]CRG93710.1 hypothetical protein PGAL8A_00141600 [Plasmodium gallinaceum]